MAIILTTDLQFTPGPSPSIVVSIGLNFTAREIQDDYEYCVHTAVVRVRNGQIVFIKNSSSYESFDILSIPPTPDLEVGYTRVKLKPGGKPIVSFLVPIQMNSPLASGDRIQSVISVVPEIAVTSSGTPEMVVP